MARQEVLYKYLGQYDIIIQHITLRGKLGYPHNYMYISSKRMFLASVLPVYYQCVVRTRFLASVSPVYCQCVARNETVFFSCQCLASVSPVYCQMIVVQKYQR